MTMFETEQFIEECRAALADSDAHGAINANGDSSPQP